MKLTVLCDNNTLIDQYFYGEPGVSLLIEAEDKKILLDTGYSNIFIKNAQRLGLDLITLDYLVLSHGHDDHTGGLASLLKYYEVRKMSRQVTLVAHEGVFQSKFSQDRDIGMNLKENALRHYFQLKKTSQPYWLTDKLVYLGQIPRRFNFENQKPIGTIQNEHGQLEPDYLLDDSALAYCAAAGLVIMTGCSHSGICNIVEQAKIICQDHRIVDVIGGFHLLEAEPELLACTRQYLRAQQPTCLHPCHCTDLQAKIFLAAQLPVQETGVGAVYTF